MKSLKYTKFRRSSKDNLFRPPSIPFLSFFLSFFFSCGCVLRVGGIGNEFHLVRIGGMHLCRSTMFRRNKYMLFAGWEVCMEKNCDRGLEKYYKLFFLYFIFLNKKKKNFFVKGWKH